MAGRGTRATQLLTAQRIRYSVHEYDHDPQRGPYGLEAAAALAVPAERVFKTLIAEVDGKLTVAVVPVAGSLDLKALAGAAGGKKARMADPAAAERATGYVTGGISPLGQRRRLPVVLDATAMDFETVFCSAGQRGLEVELAPADLARAAGAVLAPIARPAS
ncbi:MAG TPA: Cys-tRNA(Pro) deacylase [Streptosporangiaceae bacterium]|nr:Cys-tRNA(Pro) deacylase [Streptosporangiaceae bacterium]